VVTQVLVDEADPAFQNPSKPIGPFLSQEEAERRRDALGWRIREDSGRGWRRLVPSPRPIKVIQRHMIRDTARAGTSSWRAAAAGFPSRSSPTASTVGSRPVIDKDLTSSVLATTSARRYWDPDRGAAGLRQFRQAEQQALGAVTLEELERLQAEGHFLRGAWARRSKR